MSNPFTEEKKDAMQELISGTVYAFSHSYAIAFTQALVNHLRKGGTKRRSSMVQPEGLKLFAAPDPTEIIYAGWMEKKGAWNKGWKKRWFVCYNKDKNFIVSYYASETNLKKAKGEILLDGYSVTDDLSDAERKDCESSKESTNSCLKLTCGPASKRRSWFVRADSAESIDKFREPLKNACKKARAGFTAGDPVEGAAFEAAYNDVRFAMSLPPSPAGGTESECLGGLVAEVVINEVMGEVFDAFPNDMKGRAMRSGAEKAMDTAITASVGAAWQAAKGVAAKGRDSMESGIKGVLGPIQEAESMLYEKIGSLVEAVTEPAIEAVKGSVVVPMVDGVLAPISAGYQTALKVWARIARQIVEQTKGNASDLDSACAVGYREYWNDKAVDEACAGLEAALGAMGEVLADFPALELVLQLKDGMYNLISRGIATLQANINTGSTPDEAYTLTLSHAVSDSKLLFSVSLQTIVAAIAMPLFNTACKEPVVELAQPIEEQIPEAVVKFVSVSALIEGCMDSMMDSLIQSCVKEPAFAELEKLHLLEGELARDRDYGDR
jgi:hypothetical protein